MVKAKALKPKKKRVQQAAVTAGLMLLSEHLLKDRRQRLDMILEAVNYDPGEIVLEVPNPEGGKKECITEKGLIQVIALDSPMLITTYFGTIDKISAMYHAMGYSRVPDWMYNRVMKNAPYIEKQTEISRTEK